MFHFKMHSSRYFLFLMPKYLLIPMYLVAFVSSEPCSRASYHNENQSVDFQCMIVICKCPSPIHLDLQ